MPSDLLKKLSQHLIPKHGLTALAGFLANVKHEQVKNYLIQRFVNEYQINMQEAVIENPLSYACFNDFFIRRLKPECRPLAEADIISPVDGYVSELGSIQKEQLIQAKGLYYSVADLLACTKEVAEQFIDGSFATLYLSPKDYHRVHMPIDAELVSMTYVPGSLFSVQPSTVQLIPRLFARNERLVISFSTKVGPMALVMVGATLVGSIGTRWHGDLQRSKNRADFKYNQAAIHKKIAGEEVGYFKLGSTVILLFTNSAKIQWDKDLKIGSQLRFGQALGKID